MIRLFRKQGAAAPVSRSAALACRPVKHPRISDETLAAGVVRVSFPLRPRPWIAGIARRFGNRPETPVIKRLDLDEMGSAAWRLIDGRRTVAEIIQAFSSEYQLHPREAEVSVTLFIRELGKRGIIGLSPPGVDDPGPASSQKPDGGSGD
jgi:hypothetical protein